jgi:hypothetical protein
MNLRHFKEETKVEKKTKPGKAEFSSYFFFSFVPINAE